MVCVAGLVIAISIILVLKPTHDAWLTDKTLKAAYGGSWTSNPIASTNLVESSLDPAGSSAMRRRSTTALDNQGVPVAFERSDREDGSADESDRASRSDPHTPLVIRVS